MYEEAMSPASCHEMAFFTSNNNFILQSPHHHQSSSLNPMLPAASCTHQDFPGVGVAAFLGKRAMSFPGVEVSADMIGEEEVLSDDGSQGGEKKRRLNMEQVKTLEKNFELGNKLEPERKMQLARALGLQPRQIAIWFQNRRARWKTKQLEKDYDLLKRQFEAIKADNEAIHAQNRKLQAQIMALKNREPMELINLNKVETEGSSSNNSSEVKMENNNKNEGGVEIESPISSRSGLFPVPQATSSTGITVTQLFHTSAPISSNNHHQMVKEENLISNMFCGIEDHSGFWPWLEHQHFN